MPGLYDNLNLTRKFLYYCMFIVPGHPLQAKSFGSYVIESRLNDLNYIVKTHTRRKKRQVFHVTAPDFSVYASDVCIGVDLLQEVKMT